MPSEIAQITTKIHLHDLPEALLQQIFSFIEPTRARNSASLVCRRWRDLERRTRSSLSLRGNPFTIPYPPFHFPSFPSLSSLDLSNLSPWGRPLSNTPLLVGPTLPDKFPGVNSLKLYSRDPTALISLTHHWPKLKRVKLVRWHNRPSGAGITIGSDLHPLFENCAEIEEIDLNEFYCWTEDVTEAIRSYPLVAKGLTGLDLMLANATDGFRASELVSISEVCPNLQRLVAPCVFNPRSIALCLYQFCLLFLELFCMFWGKFAFGGPLTPFVSTFKETICGTGLWVVRRFGASQFEFTILDSACKRAEVSYLPNYKDLYAKFGLEKSWRLL